LSDEAIAKGIEEARHADAAETAEGLLQAVLSAARPKQDNATVAIFKLPKWIVQRPAMTTDESDDTKPFIPLERRPATNAKIDAPPP
jgi:hypothetical protein